MSDADIISIDPSFFQGLSASQKKTFDKLLKQNNFLRESVAGVEESATDRVATLNAELEDADNSIDKLESEIANLRVEVSKLQVQNDDLMEIVDTATESNKLSMLREAQVTKDAEDMIQEKVNEMDERVNQAEFNLEQKYTALLYEVQDEKDAAESLLKDVEAELKSTLVIVETKDKQNESLSKRIEQLEETKIELEEEIQGMRKEIDNDSNETISELKGQLADALDKNTELKESVSRIKWRCKEEMDNANKDMEELKQALASSEGEQQQVSAELVRVMAERDSLEAEIESGRIKQRPSGDVSDLDSTSGSVEANQAQLSHLSVSSRPLTPMRKIACSPRIRISDRSPLSIDGDNQSQAQVSISMEDHKAKMAEKQAAIEDAKRKHFLLKEEMESLRLQHTELIENNMLERKNREKLLKAAQKEKSTIQKQYKQCQKTAAAVEKELTDYLEFHKRQTEIKDGTIQVHKELAKSRAANADLAKQLVDSHNVETLTRQLNSDLESEVAMLLAEIDSLHNQLDNGAPKARKYEDSDSDSDSDSSDESSDVSDSVQGVEDEGDDDDENDHAVFCNSFRNTQDPRPSNGQISNRKPLPRKSPSTSVSTMSPANYDTLKQMYLATALDSIDKQRKGGNSRGSSVSSSPSKARAQPRMRPRGNQKANTNLNGHFSPSEALSNN